MGVLDDSSNLLHNVTEESEKTLMKVKKILKYSNAMEFSCIKTPHIRTPDFRQQPLK